MQKNVFLGIADRKSRISAYLRLKLMPSFFRCIYIYIPDILTQQYIHGNKIFSEQEKHR